jgi:hypothetical protein
VWVLRTYEREDFAQIMSLIALFVLLLVVHRHRAVIFRRFCLIYGELFVGLICTCADVALSGTVFLFRCVTMVVTSLSVPERELIECAVRLCSCL